MNDHEQPKVHATTVYTMRMFALLLDTLRQTREGTGIWWVDDAAGAVRGRAGGRLAGLRVAPGNRVRRERRDDVPVDLQPPAPRIRRVGQHPDNLPSADVARQLVPAQRHLVARGAAGWFQRLAFRATGCRLWGLCNSNRTSSAYCPENAMNAA